MRRLVKEGWRDIVIEKERSKGRYRSEKMKSIMMRMIERIGMMEKSMEIINDEDVEKVELMRDMRKGMKKIDLKK